MAKQTIDTLAELKTKLNYLKVKRCIEKKKDYDKEILTLSGKIDFIEYGIKK